ncbi:hypothetical protein B0H34DRAFT_795487 [Crassisporium funariophilum]|nr:hypothetical protein B0H34DRAFT_795487 [Crassisporium funariophilum]
MVHIHSAPYLPLIILAALPALSVPVTQLKGLTGRTNNELTAREPTIFDKIFHKNLGRQVSEEIFTRQLELAKLYERDVAQILSKFMAKLRPHDGAELDERNVIRTVIQAIQAKNKLGPRDGAELDERDVAQIFSMVMAKIGPRDGANEVIGRQLSDDEMYELVAREPFIVGAAIKAIRHALPHVLGHRALNFNNDVLAERYIVDLD